MAEKRYYWLKLKRDFFKRHDIQIIEAMPNGKDYVLFYLKMLVESIDHEGELRFSDTIPYNEQMLSVITNTNIDIVRSAMKMFQELNMVEILDDQTIFMQEVQALMGSETKWAEKKRLQRKKGDNVPKLSPDVRQEKEIEKEIEKELDIEIEKEGTGLPPAPPPPPPDPPEPPAPPKKKRGKYGWVKLSDDEYARLIGDLGEKEAQRCIDYVDESAQGTGNKNKWKDWNIVVRKCHREKWGYRDGQSKVEVKKNNGSKKTFAELVAERSGGR